MTFKNTNSKKDELLTPALRETKPVMSTKKMRVASALAPERKQRAKQTDK